MIFFKITDLDTHHSRVQLLEKCFKQATTYHRRQTALSLRLMGCPWWTWWDSFLDGSQIPWTSPLSSWPLKTDPNSGNSTTHCSQQVKRNKLIFEGQKAFTIARRVGTGWIFTSSMALHSRLALSSGSQHREIAALLAFYTHQLSHHVFAPVLGVLLEQAARWTYCSSRGLSPMILNIIIIIIKITSFFHACTGWTVYPLSITQSTLSRHPQPLTQSKINSN